ATPKRKRKTRADGGDETSAVPRAVLGKRRSVGKNRRRRGHGEYVGSPCGDACGRGANRRSRKGPRSRDNGISPGAGSTRRRQGATPSPSHVAESGQRPRRIASVVGNSTEGSFSVRTIRGGRPAGPRAGAHHGMTERQLPSDVLSERMILGSILVDQ